MELTVQGLLVASLVLVPGFVNRYVRRRVSTAQGEQEPSELELTLASLASAMLLLALETLALFALSRMWPTLRDEMGLLISDGLEAYADRRPNALAAGIMGMALLNSIIMGVAGAIDVPDRVLKPRLRGLGISEASLWYALIAEQRKDLESARKQQFITHLRVHLKNGAAYTGKHAGMSLRPDKSGNRDLALWNATYYSKDGECQELPDRGEGNTVIVCSDEISAIEICYEAESASGVTGEP